MSFNDDEPIVDIPEAPGKPTAITAGLIHLTIIDKEVAPPEETPNCKVLLELTGAAASNNRPGVDLVTVLDISSSMKDENKLEKLKVAMRFLIEKLSPIDRLSVVTFNGGAKALCPLRQITEKAQREIESLVNGLNSGGSANIVAGLQTGLQVLNGRKLNSGRTVAILLMTNGQQDKGTDAARVPVGDVPVYTFGFGSDYNVNVLMQVAQNSKGGTFSIAQNIDNLSLVFSQCLAGLLTVVIQDLKLTVTYKQKSPESTLQIVSAGNYPQTQSITVSLGDIYSREVRKVIVDLLLPEVPSSMAANILDIDYTYRTGGKLFRAIPKTATIDWSDQEKEEVAVEVSRLSTAWMMKSANDKLVEAINNIINMLKYMFAQRHIPVDNSAPGPEELPVVPIKPVPPVVPIEPPVVPIKPVPPVVPIGPSAEDLSYYIQTTIQSLKAIDNIINDNRSR